MKKIKNKVLFIFVSCVVSLLVAMTLFATITINSFSVANADTNERYETETVNENATPRLFTQLSISLNGGDGKVWTTARNDFTLFPSTVMVIIQLYSSDTYCENYQQMTLVASNSTTDLDMSHTITAEASTGGQQKYWLGRMRYKIGTGDWQEKIAGVGLYDANGNFLGIN